MPVPSSWLDPHVQGRPGLSPSPPSPDTSADDPPARRSVLITGVSGGLGRALAVHFLDRGDDVTGLSRRRDLGPPLSELARQPDSAFQYVVGDVRFVDDCRRVVDAAVSRYGRLDVLVNNAGARTAPPLMAFDEIDERNWDDVVDTNLKGAFFCTKYALPHFRSFGGGLVVNIASVAAVQALSGMAPYCASKAGLVQLTRVTAVEGFEDHVRANAILLGSTDTGQAERTASARENIKIGTESVPRIGTMPVDEVARTIVAMCEPSMNLVTGATIAIDAGVSAGLFTSSWLHRMRT